MRERERERERDRRGWGKEKRMREREEDERERRKRKKEKVRERERGPYSIFNFLLFEAVGWLMMRETERNRSEWEGEGVGGKRLVEEDERGGERQRRRATARPRDNDKKNELYLVHTI